MGPEYQLYARMIRTDRGQRADASSSAGQIPVRVRELSNQAVQ
jgi:hypothetical protein